MLVKIWKYKRYSELRLIKKYGPSNKNEWDITHTRFVISEKFEKTFTSANDA